MDSTTRPLTQEEGEELTKELQTVLEKHNAELGVTSTITLLKRESGVPSPFQTTKTTDSKTEEGGESGSGELT